MPRLFGKKKTESKTAESSAQSSTSPSSSAPERESGDTRYNPPEAGALAGLTGKERARKEKELAREMAAEK